MKKVLLIQPNNSWAVEEVQASWRVPPYGITLIASTIRDLVEVEIYDANVHNSSKEETMQKIKDFSPDVIGITVLFDTISKAGHATAEMAKRVAPNAITVFGGVYATTNPRTAIKDPNVDYVVIGEGEFVFRNMIRHWQGECEMPVDGVCYMDGDKVVRGKRVLVEDVNTVPLPAYDLIDNTYFTEPYTRKSVDAPSELPFATIMGSRGCPVGCTFCQVETISGGPWRGRSPDNICDELEWLRAEYGIKSFVFQDDNLLTNKKAAKDLFNRMIERGVNMPWKMAATAVFKLDEELVKLMRASGCEYVCCAIESGNKRVVRDIVKKPINFEKAKKMVKVLQENGIFVTGNFIMGFPTETWAELRETISFAEELGVDYMKLFTLIPLKGTKIWEICKDHGYFRKGFEFDNVSWNKAQVRSDYYTPNDMTILRAYEWDRINFSTPERTQRTADMMGVTLDELWKIRRETLNGVPSRLEMD